MRRTQKELRVEFDRRFAILEIIREYEEHRHADLPAEIRQALHGLVVTKDDMLDLATQGKTTLGALISGLQMDINDFQLGLMDCDTETYDQKSVEERGPNTPEFLALYKSRTGRDFYGDVVDMAETARKTVKRGKINNEVEYYVAAELASDLSQTVLSSAEMVRPEAMIAAFNGRAQCPVQ